MTNLKKILIIASAVLLANSLLAQNNGTYEWRFDETCTQSSVCGDINEVGTFCFGLWYTPEVTGAIRNYTNQTFSIQCTGGGGTNPTTTNQHCGTLTDNSLTSGTCVGPGVAEMAFSASNGTDIPITAGVPILLHEFCVELFPGESVVLDASNGFLTMALADGTGLTPPPPANLTITHLDLCPLLPVELISFEAELDGDDGLLTWETATEVNNDRFEVERSFDGSNFTYIGEVAGSGTTDVAQQYSYRDEGITSFGAEEIYYRLRQVDFDGSYEYTPIRLIAMSGDAGLEVRTVQQGFKYKLVEKFGDGIERVDVYNAIGQLMSSTDYGLTDVAELDTHNLAVGTYLLVINEKYRKKMIVTR